MLNNAAVTRGTYHACDGDVVIIHRCVLQAVATLGGAIRTGTWDRAIDARQPRRLANLWGMAMDVGRTLVAVSNTTRLEEALSVTTAVVSGLPMRDV